MKIKTYGPSNDVGVPPGELMLAKMVQSAKARGMRPLHGPKYAMADGTYVAHYQKETAECCCAYGAADLDNDVGGNFSAVIQGHERPWDPSSPFDDAAYQAGAAFDAAMLPQRPVRPAGY